MNVVPSKIDAELLFFHFLAIFELFKFTKGLIFGIFILDLSPKWLLDALNIDVANCEQKRIIFILIFWDFFANIKRYPKF